MKYILLLFSGLLISFIPKSEDAKERLGIKGPLEYNKQNFALAWTDHPSDVYYIQEYLPAGEKLESFNQMLTIHLFDTKLEPRKAVEQKVAELNKRKSTDPICNYQVTESPDGKEYMVDFLLGESKDNQMTVVELNIYRYKQVDLGNNKKGILVYAYSKRSYGDTINSFFKTFKKEREKYLNQMIAPSIPVVSINN